MNAERLHAIVIALRDEIKRTSVVQRMQEMVNALRALSQQPHPTYQQQLASSLQSFYEAVTNTRSDNFSPAWRQVLVEIGGEEFFGRRLKEHVENVLAKNQMTPAVALEQLQQTLDGLQKFAQALDQAAAAVEVFGIGHEELAPGESEIGLLIPRGAVKNQLIGFMNELSELGFILNTFSEVATGAPDELAIRTLSSSDFLVYLAANAPYAACVAVAIERIVSLYKQLLEIRKLRQDIQNQGVPEDRTSGIDDYANHLMETGIEKASTEIVAQFYKGKDSGRKNELAVAVRLSMNEIANRIDRGYNIEVRVAPLPAGDQSKEDKEIQKPLQSYRRRRRTRSFLNSEGSRYFACPRRRGIVRIHQENEIGRVLARVRPLPLLRQNRALKKARIDSPEKAFCAGFILTKTG